MASVDFGGGFFISSPNEFRFEGCFRVGRRFLRSGLQADDLAKSRGPKAKRLFKRTRRTPLRFPFGNRSGVRAESRLGLFRRISRPRRFHVRSSDQCQPRAPRIDFPRRPRSFYRSRYLHSVPVPPKSTAVVARLDLRVRTRLPKRRWLLKPRPLPTRSASS